MQVAVSSGLKIYFARSINGLSPETKAEWEVRYRMIGQILRQLGHELTDEFVVNIPADAWSQTPNETYEKDIAAIDAADVVVAEVSVPSIGVGYEIGYAEAKGKPVICLYYLKAGHKISSMVAGNPRSLQIFYESYLELYHELGGLGLEGYVKRYKQRNTRPTQTDIGYTLNQYMHDARRTGNQDTLVLGDVDRKILHDVLYVLSTYAASADKIKKIYFHKHGGSKVLEQHVITGHYPNRIPPVEQELEQLTVDQTRLLNSVFGKLGEAGEIADLVDRLLFGDGQVTREQISKETGDGMWYDAQLCDALHTDLETVAKQNIEKLRKRYPDGFSTEASLARADVVE